MAAAGFDAVDPEPDELPESEEPLDELLEELSEPEELEEPEDSEELLLELPRLSVR